MGRSMRLGNKIKFMCRLFKGAKEEQPTRFRIAMPGHSWIGLKKVGHKRKSKICYLNCNYEWDPDPKYQLWKEIPNSLIHQYKSTFGKDVIADLRIT